MILKTVLPKETAHATMSETEVAEMESNVSPFLRLRLLQDAELEPSVRRHSPPPLTASHPLLSASPCHSIPPGRGRT